jgi:hypothetical protein
MVLYYFHAIGNAHSGICAEITYCGEPMSTVEDLKIDFN